MAELTTAAAFGIDVAIFALAAWIGATFTPRVRATRLWFPVTVLFGAIAMFGGTDAGAQFAGMLGYPELANELGRAATMSSGFAVPAILNFVTAYPRALNAKWVRWGIAAAYFVGITYTVLTPTSLMVAVPPTAPGGPVYGPAYWPLTGVITVLSFVALFWTAFLALRGKTAAEKKGGVALSISIVVPLGIYSAVTAIGLASAFGGPAVALYYLAFTVVMAGVLFTRRLEPPIPSTFRSLVDSVDEGVIVVDAHGRVSSVNPAARRLLALGDGPVGQEGVADLFLRTLGDGEAAGFVERTLMGVQRGRIETHDGTLENAGSAKLSLRWRVYPLGRRDGRGESEGALLMLRDETRRQALEKSTEQSRDVLDLVIRMLGHDLKAPLTVLQGYMDLDKMRLDSSTDPATAAKVKADLDKMSEAVVSMHMMMGNARALSRLAARGTEAPELSELDLTKQVGLALDLLKPAASAKQIKVERQVEEGLKVKAVPGFDSVPRNLLDNAIKYTPPGGTVTMTLAKAGNTVRLKVSDTGQGIPPDRKDQLFKKFERLGAERGPAEGHGLGLSIVAKLVELSGGKVEAREREDGKSGAVFIVDLPAN